MATVVLPVLQEKLGPWKSFLCSVGVFYVAKVAVTFTWKAVNVVRGYFFSRLRPLDIGRFGGWAVITGAADGIGKAYSRKLASCGYNVVLVDRCHGNLQSTAEGIVQEFGVEARTAQIEFGPNVSVYDKLERHLSDIDIGVLVNNVGLTYDYPDLFLNISNQMLWKLIEVNIAATTFVSLLTISCLLATHSSSIHLN
jgi:17beta-estradiol 17-dehydrogenase / very-long-chain 3-oxoacyl-CoA reductase